MITQLRDDDGNILVNHNEKANLIWLSFKERLGVSNFSSHCYDLAAHLLVHPDLSMLVEPFAKSEVDAAVKSLPSDKAHGFDGFNTDFFKHCWPLICSDFYRLCEEFYANNLCLQSINGSFVTLITKKDDA